MAADRNAFATPYDGDTYQENGEAPFEFRDHAGELQLREIVDGTPGPWRPAAGVIGIDPLIQYLIPTERGRLQATSAAWDPEKEAWFHVYEDDRRTPGDWGHWLGQGMNWNANCAYCHMTEYHKNYDAFDDAYASTWTHQAITCIQCHTGMDAHLNAMTTATGTKAYPPSAKALTNEQWMHSCATCHARRGELTAEAFKPGDSFHDHYTLAFPDESDIYHPDGQVNNENYVYTSFMMSRMGHKGVSCFDCHDEHSMELTLPVDNNALCLKCHATGVDDSIKIVPEAHTFHVAGTPGSRCVDCHMPVNTFMQRDDRHDHIFNSPDPYLTKTLGIPNTCNQCHTDQSVDWAIEWSGRWYGDKLANRRSRARAMVIADARAGNAAAIPRLIDLLKTEDIDIWKASLIMNLAKWSDQPRVQATLELHLGDEHPVVRAAAVSALSRYGPQPRLIGKYLDDPIRSVRIAAARALQPMLPADHPAAKELRASLEFTADTPMSALQLADMERQHAQTGRGTSSKQVVRWATHAVNLEPNSAEVRRQAAVVASASDTQQAAVWLDEAKELEPNSAEIAFSLGLLQAELGKPRQAAAEMERAVRIDATFDRAWYNLALMRLNAGDTTGALQAAQTAVRLIPRNRDYQYLLAVVLHRSGRRAEAEAIMRQLR